jgi:SAM-dependent methyltransferase
VGCGQHKRGIGIDIDKNSKADIIGDVQFLPFRNKAFDTTICEEVLEHVRNPTKALREIRRVSKRICLTVPNIFYFGRILRHYIKKPAEISKEHIHAFGVAEMTNLMRDAKFKIVHTDFINAETGRYHKRNLPTILFKHNLRVIAHSI